MIKEKLPKATSIDFHRCGSFHRPPLRNILSFCFFFFLVKIRSSTRKFFAPGSPTNDDRQPGRSQALPDCRDFYPDSDFWPPFDPHRTVNWFSACLKFLRSFASWPRRFQGHVEQLQRRCSLGNDPRVLMILRNDMFKDSMALVVYITFRFPA